MSACASQNDWMAKTFVDGNVHTSSCATLVEVPAVAWRRKSHMTAAISMLPQVRRNGVAAGPFRVSCLEVTQSRVSYGGNKTKADKVFRQNLWA